MPLPRLAFTSSGEANPMSEFLKDLLYQLGNMISPRSRSRYQPSDAQDWIDTQWLRFLRSHPGPWMLYEGCAVAGLTVLLGKGTILLHWNTYFRPAARYGSPGLDATALGYFKEFELYALRPGDRPLMVVRWNEEHPGARWMLNGRPSPPESHAEPLLEALRRAHLVNILAGTQWASPMPDGSLGIPTKVDEYAPPKWNSFTPEAFYPRARYR